MLPADKQLPIIHIHALDTWSKHDGVEAFWGPFMNLTVTKLRLDVSVRRRKGSNTPLSWFKPLKEKKKM